MRWHAQAELAGVAAMALAGAGIALSVLLEPAPPLSSQAVRYGLAALVLRGIAVRRGERLRPPRADDWPWVILVAVFGMAAINVVLLRGLRFADPAVFGIALGCVPVVLALGGSLLARRRPASTTTTGTVLLVVGATLVAGCGTATWLGLAMAALMLVCEAAFTMFAVPVLPRLGAWSVSYHGCVVAAVLLGASGLVVEGPTAMLRLSWDQLLVIGFLAIASTAVAFVLWFLCVDAVGADGSAALIGAMPTAATTISWICGFGAPSWRVAAGVAVCALAVAIGTRSTPTPTPSPTPPSARPSAGSADSVTAS